jgi:YHS domain-containing protein
MKTWLPISMCLTLALAAPAVSRFDGPLPAREALKPLNVLIGEWKGTGQPEGTRRDKQSGFWTEDLAWSWHFKGDDAWLGVTFDQGKHFASGELRHVPDKDLYRLSLKGVDGAVQTFEGRLKDKVLTLDREDGKSKETERLVFTFLHDNRFLYRLDKRPAGRSTFTKVYQVGATKKGAAFAAGETAPECIVSGGKGTMTVIYKGQTYYVCCSGCRDAFKDDPEKFIKEWQEKKGKK